MTERRPRSSPRRVVAAVAATGLLLTVLSTYATAKVDDNTEQRLLQTQTKQAGAVLSAAIQLIERPLTSALDIQRTTGGDPRAFRTAMAPYVGPGRTFVAASLWERDRGQLRQLSRVGVAPAMPASAASTRTFLRRAFAVPTFAVGIAEFVPDDPAVSGVRVTFAEAGRDSSFVVYAERSIAADRRTPSDRDSAFAELHYANYIGRTTDSAALATTDLPLDRLPITDRDSFRTELPFGDTQLTLVTVPRGHLGGSLSEHLPVTLLVAGLLLTFLASRLVGQVVRGRFAAESDAATISDLYERVDALYGEQREVSVRLQRALLPPSNPVIPDLEIASDYVAGARGVDIGGDWWSIVRLDEERFAFVVGDVSGRGIDAVAVMARARFTLRAYLLDGQSPGVALEKCSRQFDITVDGHLTTVLVGVGNRTTGEITVANAGHPPPLLLHADGSTEFVYAPVGAPLGTGQGAYATADLVLPAGSTLVAYTDGLVERRGEDIDVSLQRLRTTVEGLPVTSLDEFVREVLESMRDAGEDDVAVLAIKRRSR